MGQVSRGYGGPSLAGLAGVLPGAIVMFFGLMGLVGVQMGRATVDTAEFTQQGLKIAREQLEVSRQSLKQGAVLEQGYAALQAAKAELQSDAGTAPTISYGSATGASEVDGSNGKNGKSAQIEASPATTSEFPIIYEGRTIEKQGNQYLVDGKGFISFDDAKRYANQNPKQGV